VKFAFLTLIAVGSTLLGWFFHLCLLCSLKHFIPHGFATGSVSLDFGAKKHSLPDQMFVIRVKSNSAIDIYSSEIIIVPEAIQQCAAVEHFNIIGAHFQSLSAAFQSFFQITELEVACGRIHQRNESEVIDNFFLIFCIGKGILIEDENSLILLNCPAILPLWGDGWKLESEKVQAAKHPRRGEGIARKRPAIWYPERSQRASECSASEKTLLTSSK